MTEPEPPAAGPATGFYGKLPAKGDFVTRRMPRGFVEAWDRWLQSSIETSRDQLGEAWLEAYLNGPLWRFALPAGQCGDQAVAGVLMPSVDRVGRYFPLTVAAPLVAEAIPTDIPSAAADWFEAVEELALSALADDFDFDGFDKAVEDAGPPLGLAGDGEPGHGAPPPAAAVGDLADGLRQALGADGDPWPVYPHLLHAVLGAVLGGYGLWWTAGSDRVEGSLVVCRELPPADRFAALLDGDWVRWGWQRPEPAVAPESPVTGDV
jgi:type VI secretion system protein ImpM